MKGPWSNSAVQLETEEDDPVQSLPEALRPWHWCFLVPMFRQTEPLQLNTVIFTAAKPLGVLIASDPAWPSDALLTSLTSSSDTITSPQGIAVGGFPLEVQTHFVFA